MHTNGITGSYGRLLFLNCHPGDWPRVSGTQDKCFTTVPQLPPTPLPLFFFFLDKCHPLRISLRCQGWTPSFSVFWAARTTELSWDKILLDSLGVSSDKSQGSFQNSLRTRSRPQRPMVPTSLPAHSAGTSQCDFSLIEEMRMRGDMVFGSFHLSSSAVYNIFKDYGTTY